MHTKQLDETEANNKRSVMLDLAYSLSIEANDLDGLYERFSMVAQQASSAGQHRPAGKLTQELRLGFTEFRSLLASLAPEVLTLTLTRTLILTLSGAGGVHQRAGVERSLPRL